MNLTNLALLTQIALRDRRSRVSSSTANPPHPMLDVKKLLTELYGGDFGLQLDNPAFHDLLCAPTQMFPSASFFIALEQATTQEQKERAAQDMLKAIRYGVPEVPEVAAQAPEVAAQAPDARFRDLQETWERLRQYIINNCESSLASKDPPAPEIPPAPFGEAGGFDAAFDDLEPLGEWEDQTSASDGIDIFAEGGMPSLTSLSDQDSSSPTFESILYDEYTRGLASFDAEKAWGYDDDLYFRE